MEEADLGLPPLAAHGAPIDPALAVNAANRAARVSAYQQQMRQQQQYPYASGTQEKKPDISSLDATLWNQPHLPNRYDLTNDCFGAAPAAGVGSNTPHALPRSPAATAAGYHPLHTGAAQAAAASGYFPSGGGDGYARSGGMPAAEAYRPVPQRNAHPPPYMPAAALPLQPTCGVEGSCAT